MLHTPLASTSSAGSDALATPLLPVVVERATSPEKSVEAANVSTTSTFRAGSDTVSQRVPLTTTQMNQLPPSRSITRPSPTEIQNGLEAVARIAHRSFNPL